ncbi:MAG: plasmid pRiA4b ORF-3 family protein [Dysgonamonadaceae bacterium]|jgi:hypothetical protein|nr:plasmid pRiA4b ORF-3 family protein [Dysgonamonadaceae bacterium]
MVYRFIVLSDEVDNFRRDIIIDSDATFYDLHEAILDSVNYTKDQMTSFFICDDDWAKKTEITLVEMDSNPEEDSYVMELVHLRDFIEEERQKLIYVFEYLTDRSFFIELREIVPGKKLEKAEVVRSDGKAPVQQTNSEELDFTANTASASFLDDEDLFDDEINLDEYSDEDFGDLIDGNPFDNY